jgi:hypothetical protein
MKKTKMWLLVVALMAILLVATGSAAAGSPVTHFASIGYVCEQLDPFGSWGADGVVHDRGILLYDVWVSDEPRAAGDEISLLHRDIDLETEVLHGWGTQTVLTSAGTWYTELEVGLNDDGVFVSHGTGHGGDGLEGMFISWTGRQLLYVPTVEEGAPCESELALELIGAIRPGYGPRVVRPGIGPRTMPQQ